MKECGFAPESPIFQTSLAFVCHAAGLSCERKQIFSRNVTASNGFCDLNPFFNHRGHREGTENRGDSGGTLCLSESSVSF